MKNAIKKIPHIIIFVVRMATSHPSCGFFQRDSLLPGKELLRIPEFHKTDISLDVPLPPHPCTLDLSNALVNFVHSSTPHMKLRITCYHMVVEILPIPSDIDKYIETLDLTMVQCNTSYADISNLTPEKIFGLTFIDCNISTIVRKNKTTPCHGVTNLLRIGFLRCFNKAVWTQLISCDIFLKNVYWLTIQYTPYNVVQDIYKFQRLQYLKLSDVGLDIFPQKHLSYAGLGSNKTYPNMFTYFAPFSKTFNDFEFVVMRVLDFSQNNITKLPCLLSSNYIPVHLLNLNDNKIRWLSSSLLKTIRHLVQVDFSNNLIETIPENLFNGLQTIQNIYFQSNLLSSIPKFLFLGLVLLQQVNFADNRLVTLDPQLFSINQRYISALSINLGSNMLKSIPEGLFKDVSVSSLDLKNNSLTEITPELLTHADLRQADFSYNPINGSGLAKVALSFLDTGIPRGAVPHVLDLSYCNISTIPDGRNFSIVEITSYQMFFSTFQVLLHNNPINCTCNMRVFVIDLLNRIGFSSKSENQLDKLYVEDNFFDSWKCYFPEEYRGYEMMKLPSSEFYCRIMTSTCPDDCECYWYEDERLLIDCSNTNYTDIPDDIEIPDLSSPNNFRIHTSDAEEINLAIAKSINSTTIHLKFSHAELREISYSSYLSMVTTLDVSFNKLTSISDHVIRSFNDNINITFDLSNNQLSYIPQEIMSLDLKQVRVGNNPYVCDCNSLWMKYWLRDRRVPVADWKDVTCIDFNKQGRVFIEVPDEDFICPPKFNTVREVVLPATSIGAAIIFIMFSCILSYMYKQELKVLLFVYFGIHPFDKHERKFTKDECLDVFIAHGEDVCKVHQLEELKKYLQDRDLSVSMLSHDRLIGYTHHENISQPIVHSKRIIIYVERESDMKNIWFTTCWNLAKEKIKRTRTNYAVLVYAGKQPLKIKDKELKRYVSHGRLIKMNEIIALKKIYYLMPKQTKRNARIGDRQGKDDCVVVTTQTSIETAPDNLDEPNKIRWSVFVSYDSQDLLYVRLKLMPLLEQRGLILHIPDRDFDVGVPIESNIVKAIDGSRHTLFILSDTEFSDEWRRFVFNLAREKSVGEKSNHLIVVIKPDVATDALSDELKSYFQTYVCLKLDDPLFVHVLFNTLMGSKN